MNRSTTLTLASAATLLLLAALALSAQEGVPAWLPPTVLLLALMLGGASVFGAWRRPTPPDQLDLILAMEDAERSPRAR